MSAFDKYLEEDDSKVVKEYNETDNTDSSVSKPSAFDKYLEPNKDSSEVVIDDRTESYAQKKYKEAKATGEDPTFFSEASRSVIGGAVDASNAITGLYSDTLNFLQETIPIPYYTEIGNDNNIIDIGDINPFNWIKKMPKGANAKAYITDKNKQLGFKDGNPWRLPEANENETVAGKVARDITRFIVGYVVARKGMKKTYNKKLENILDRKGDNLKEKIVSGGSRFAETVVTGITGGQLVSDGTDGRLSDLLLQIPSLNEDGVVKDALEYLKMNPKDSEAENRLKMAIEDALLALPVEVGLKAIKLLYGGSKDVVAKAIKDKANLIESNAPVIDDALNIENIKLKPVKDRTAIEKILIKNDLGKKLNAAEQVKLDDYNVAQKLKTFESPNLEIEASVRESMGLKPNQTATQAEKAVIDKITNLKRTFNVEKIDELPFLNIKFINNAGKPLFSGADDGVDTLVLDIVNQLKTAKATGTSQSHETTVKRAIKLGLTDKVLKKIGTNVLNPELVTASRILFVASANNLKRISDSIIRNPENIKLLKGDLELATIRHMSIQEKLSGLAANAGRTLNAFNIDIGGSTLFKNKQIDDIVSEFGNDTIGMARKIVEQGDAGISNVIKDKFDSTLTDRINALFYFNFLSNPSTLLINAIGNAGTLLYEQMLALPMSATISTVRRMGQGLAGKKVSKDGVYIREVVGRFKGTVQATLPAVVNFYKSIRYGELPVELRRAKTTEYEEMILAGKGSGKKKGLGSKLISGVIKAPGAFLLGTDAFFKTLAKGAFVNQMAYREAAKKGYSMSRPFEKIDKLTQGEFIQKFLQQPRPLLEKKALEEAARVTFTKDGKLAQFVSKTKRVPVLGNIVVSYFPFVRTPINLLEYSMENSIFAKLTPGYRELVKKGGADKDTAYGRMYAGTSLMAAYLFYGEEGKITGTGDANWRVNSTARNALGFQTKSVKDDKGNYHEFSRFDPASTVIGFTADFRDIIRTAQYMPDGTKTEEYVSHAAKMIMSSIWNNVADKAMLAGLSDLSKDVVTAEKGLSSEGGAEYAGKAILKQLARALSPNILRSAARANDPYVRDTYTVLQVIKNALPFKTFNINLKEYGIPIDATLEGKATLPLRFDLFGRLMYLPEYGPKGFAERLTPKIRDHIIDLTGINEKNVKEFIYTGGSAPSESLKTDLIQQATTLSRLSIYRDDNFGRELVKLRYEDKPLSRKITIGSESVDLDPEQFAVYSMLAGLDFYQRGHDMINSDVYKDFPPKEKQINLDKIRAASKAMARSHVLKMFSKQLEKKGYSKDLQNRREAPYWTLLPNFLRDGYLKEDQDIKQ